MSSRTTTPTTTPTTTYNTPGAVDDLIHMIDQHLAFSLDHDARSLHSHASQGTLFVDFDGTDAPIVHYRHQFRRAAPTSGALAAAEHPRRDSMFGSRAAERNSGFEDGYGGRMGRGCRDGRPAAVVLEDGEVDAGACGREWEVQVLRQGRVLELERERVRERRRNHHHHHHHHSSHRHDLNAHSSSRRRHRHADNGNVQLKARHWNGELPLPPADREVSSRRRVANFIARLWEKLAFLRLLEHGDRHGECGHRHTGRRMG